MPLNCISGPLPAGIDERNLQTTHTWDSNTPLIAIDFNGRYAVSELTWVPVDLRRALTQNDHGRSRAIDPVLYGIERRLFQMYHYWTTGCRCGYCMTMRYQYGRRYWNYFVPFEHFSLTEEFMGSIASAPSYRFMNPRLVTITDDPEGDF